jgi:hypothetical protein
MKRVCHQTIPCQPHRHLLVSLPQQVHKRSEVVICVKDVTPAIAPCSGHGKQNRLAILWVFVA